MRNATHEVLGGSLALATGQALGVGAVETVALVAAAVCGSRLPDVDQLGSRIHCRSALERRSTLFGVAGAAMRLPLLAFAAVIPHRGLTHSAVACAAVPCLAALIVSPLSSNAAVLVGIGIAIGYAAHIAADACTPGGVRLWAPVSSRRVWLLPPKARIPTGSLREAAVAALALAALAVTLWA